LVTFIDTKDQPGTGYTLAEELAHVVTHGAGVILSIAGLSWMLYLSVEAADPWRVLASTVYGVSLIALFLASTLYHAMHASPHRHWYKLADHCAIYLLIAGTYTPFLVIAMQSSTGWWLFGIIWTLATIGILAKLRFRHRYPRLSLISYLLMGWLVIVAAPEVIEAIGRDGMVWLAAGGLSYTIGALFYMAKKVTYSHAVWHVFVLIGGVCHFLTVVWYVLPGELPASTGA
jgi:hemolysin III